ncbi:glycosyltransferase [Tannockella kyphosi]|uniref:glycosyltransferase n=1 Tax=Tannockella kyphosi TaxID=2899121 RepID=UPI0020134A3B|nr:glycosyltransferase [Tannockella kyphosi]
MKLKKRHFSKNYLNKSKYLKHIENTVIDDHMIVLESQKGANLHGNIFYILKELLCNEEYADYKIYVSVTKNNADKFRILLNQYNLSTNLLIMGTAQYYKIISQTKYIILDTSHEAFFIKKEGQVILNVWHGTPLKTLGKKDYSGMHTLGNVQKSFFIADFLLYPSEYMMKHMIEDYMLNNIAEGVCLLGGYPRNEAFLNDVNPEIVETLQLSGKEVIGYMPTWRGSVGKVDRSIQIIHISHYLLELDKSLTENQVLLVNLHPFIGDALNFEMFKNIIPFPKEYETYDVLNVCDQLITDYSSVFFDFAITKRKILLFAYDESEYLTDRGLYIQLDELPFPVLKTVPELIDAINEPKGYDESEFLKTFASYENKEASSTLLERIILGKKMKVELPIPNNGKQNVLIYSGGLAKNGITTALFNLLNEIDVNKYNYYLTFAAKAVVKHKDILLNLPKGVCYIPTVEKMNAGVCDKFLIVLTKKIKFNVDYDRKILDRIYQYEIKRTFGNIKFSNVVQYSGYEMKKQMLFGRFMCNKIIYVHNNMVSEINVRGAQKPNMLRYAYNSYDKIALVTEDMREPTLEFCNNESKFFVANNIIDYNKIIEMSTKQFSYDEDTISTLEIEELEKILKSESRVFINIGRFSPEKGHFRLIDAFEKVYSEEENKPYLIILGGHGVLYNETLEYAVGKNCKDNIIIIKSMSNPFPLLKKCDYFVLSSLHEGFGLVLAEADILGLPVMSTDILGPKLFMEKHGGLLVEESLEGIVLGMKKMMLGEIKPLGVDYELMNKTSVKQFEDMLL